MEVFDKRAEVEAEVAKRFVARWVRRKAYLYERSVRSETAGGDRPIVEDKLVGRVDAVVARQWQAQGDWSASAGTADRGGGVGPEAVGSPAPAHAAAAVRSIAARGRWPVDVGQVPGSTSGETGTRRLGGRGYGVEGAPGRVPCAAARVPIV